MALVVSVAKELVRHSLAGDEMDPLTNLRLQKLLYYAQAWSLVIRESELFSEEIEAWRYGPVVPCVYRELPDNQRAAQISVDAFEDAPDLEADDAEFVRRVWEAYNQYSALKLSKMTHEEAPWKRAWGNRPLDGTGNDPISVDDLEEHFAKQSVPAPLAAYSHELRRREEEAAKLLADIPPLDAARLRAASTSTTPAAQRHLADKG